MSNLTPYSSDSGGLLSRAEQRGASRQLSRDLTRVQHGGLIRAAQTDIEARLADIKIGVATGLGTSAQQHVATMTAMEGELIKAVPLAAGRLELIGNLTTIGTTEIVTDAIAKLRRI